MNASPASIGPSGRPQALPRAPSGARPAVASGRDGGLASLMRPDLLPEAHRRLWPCLAEVPDHFTLYGGAGLALRGVDVESPDFDFFSEEDLDPEGLLASLKFLRGGAAEIPEASGSLLVTLPGGVKAGFFGGRRNGRLFVEPPGRADNGLRVASLPDIFGRKCVTLCLRRRWQDYADIHAVLAGTEYSLLAGLCFGLALYGDSCIAPRILQFLAFHGRQGGRLSRERRALLLQAVSGVDLRLLPLAPGQHSYLRGAKLCGSGSHAPLEPIRPEDGGSGTDRGLALTVAREVNWYTDPRETLLDVDRFLSEIMARGSLQAMQWMLTYYRTDDLVSAYRKARPCLFRRSAWAYWGLMLLGDPRALPLPPYAHGGAVPLEDAGYRPGD